MGKRPVGRKPIVLPRCQILLKNQPFGESQGFRQHLLPGRLNLRTLDNQDASAASPREKTVVPAGFAEITRIVRRLLMILFHMHERIVSQEYISVLIVAGYDTGVGAIDDSLQCNNRHPGVDAFHDHSSVVLIIPPGMLHRLVPQHSESMQDNRRGMDYMVVSMIPRLRRQHGKRGAEGTAGNGAYIIVAPSATHGIQCRHRTVHKLVLALLVRPVHSGQTWNKVPSHTKAS
ncbi:hypothetical protein D3C75_763590 [compost metagenome]